jgi:hypothetical protein
MKSTVVFTVVPLQVPKNVYVELAGNGVSRQSVSSSVQELSVEALEELCVQFRFELFATAKKELPTTDAPAEYQYAANNQHAADVKAAVLYAATGKSPTASPFDTPWPGLLADCAKIAESTSDREDIL